MKRIAVFCGASKGNDPIYTEKAYALGKYLAENHLDYCEDETNEDISYNRNFVRNVLMKEIKSRWPNVEQALVNFAKSVKDDDEYINKQIYAEAIITEDKVVKIPTSYFLYDKALVSRIIFRAVKSIGINQDIERKHIEARRLQ